MIDRWRTKKFKATKFIQIPDQQKFHFITKKMRIFTSIAPDHDFRLDKQ